MIKTMKNFNLSLNKYIYLVYRMFGDRTWDRIGYLICIVRDRLSTDFEKLGGCHTPPPPPHTPLMCAPVYNRFGDTFIRQWAQFFIVFRATAHVGTIRGESCRQRGFVVSIDSLLNVWHTAACS